MSNKKEETHRMRYPNAPVAAQVLQVYQLLRRELLIAREGWGCIDLFKKKCTHRVSFRAKVQNPLTAHKTPTSTRN